MRLIDADKLYEDIVNTESKAVPKEYDKKVFDVVVNRQNEILDMIRDQPTISTSNNWIPVSERLPEEDIDVLVTTKCVCSVLVGRYEEGIWFFSDYCHCPRIEVTAWQPLPEPFVESEEEGDEV